MGRDRTVTSQAKAWARAAQGGYPADPQRHLARAEDRLRLGGYASSIWRPHHLLAPPAGVGAGRDLGTRVARAFEPVGCPTQTRVDQSLPGRQLCSGEKGGDAVGKTKVGKGSNVMVVADGQGLPIGLHVASAQPHESQLADATLATVRVPQPRGRPRTRPQELVADKAYDSQAFALCGGGVSSPQFLRSRAETASALNVGVRSAPALTIASAGKSSGASDGWTTIGGWWCGTNDLWRITKLSV
jgi:hypothetical protein